MTFEFINTIANRVIDIKEDIFLKKLAMKNIQDQGVYS